MLSLTVLVYSCQSAVGAHADKCTSSLTSSASNGVQCQLINNKKKDLSLNLDES